MEIVRLKNKPKGFFIRVNVQEAAAIAESLCKQIATQDCNTGRLESHTEDGELLTICVSKPHPMDSRAIQTFRSIEKAANTTAGGKVTSAGPGGTLEISVKSIVPKDIQSLHKQREKSIQDDAESVKGRRERKPRSR